MKKFLASVYPFGPTILGLLLVIAILFVKTAVYFADHRNDAISICKVCHCGQTSCHQDCGEENMCVLKCEGLCKKPGDRK